ncbi:glycosyltransferase family 2 protein [Oxalobacter vibrioformis]|uniref:Glycosyltransferase family 2 protein n=1 Tax=Oxalobacter vibrioformis TaxID=933080 RepID=A0A9E9LT15_9BURK|nr:glycosyltransferase family 2 protein [Oxalobacter vibrioformis]WAW09110.1 glycosyltransferase family 2 protein [Oxalobacter vibrioformis]
MKAIPVSVIIPCYCCSDVLERAVISVINQTLKPLEIILVEDSSPDAHATRNCILHLIKKYSQHDSVCIRSLFLESNKGPAGARNAGWNIAKGDYLAFLDADDAWTPEKIEIQYSWMIQNPYCDLSGHRSVLFSSYSPELPEEKSALFLKKLTLQKMLFRNLVQTRTVMLRCSLEHRFSEQMRFSEDYDLWLRIISDGHNAVLIYRTLAFSFRPDFSLGGQSGNLWKMECSELQIYRQLYVRKKINVITWIIASAFSLTKYMRRLFIRSFALW